MYQSAIQKNAIPQELASRIAKNLQTALFRKTGLHFIPEIVHSTSPNISVISGNTHLFNPTYGNSKDSLETVRIGKFRFTPYIDPIHICVNLQENGSFQATITSEDYLLPEKAIFFGLLHKSIRAEVASSVKEALSESRRNNLAHARILDSHYYSIQHR